MKMEEVWKFSSAGSRRMATAHDKRVFRPGKREHIRNHFVRTEKVTKAYETHLKLLSEILEKWTLFALHLFFLRYIHLTWKHNREFIHFIIMAIVRPYRKFLVTAYYKALMANKTLKIKTTIGLIALLNYRLYRVLTVPVILSKFYYSMILSVYIFKNCRFSRLNSQYENFFTTIHISLDPYFFLTENDPKIYQKTEYKVQTPLKAKPLMWICCRKTVHSGT